MNDRFDAAADRLHHMQIEADGFETVQVYRQQPIPVPTSNGYADGNPKTVQSAKKPDLSVIPPAGLLHMSLAMMNGAEKYGPFNWRENSVAARVYVAAAQRHLLEFLDGEDFSADTVATGRPVHHLAHVMACCAILLDALETGNLIDNRPIKGAASRMIETYNEKKRFS